MRQLAGTKMRYRKANARPLTGLFPDRTEINGMLLDYMYTGAGSCRDSSVIVPEG